MQTERERLAQEIIKLGNRHGSWTAEDRQRWNVLNERYEATGITSRIGRDGGTIEQGPANRHVFGLEGKHTATDAALAAWVQNSCGLPITGEQAEACSRYGVAAASNAFAVNLGASRPAMGRDLLIRNSQHRGTGPAGGYTVPQGFQARLEKAMLDHSGVLQACEIWTTEDGRETPWPTIDDTSNEGAFLAEAAEATELGVEFGRVLFRSYKITSRLVKISHELLRDSAIDLPGELGAILGERIGRRLNRALTTGTGSSEPKGIVTASSLGKEAASATAIAFDDLQDLVASVDAAYLGDGCGWMMSQLVANEIRKLKDLDGRYLWEPSNQVGQPPLLLGWPVFLNNAMASTIEAGAKTVLFGQLSQYKVRRVGSVRLLRLMERFAEFDQQAFLGFGEYDGNLLDPGARAVKHLVHPAGEE